MGTPESPFVLTEPIFEKGILFGDVRQPKQSIYEENETQQYAVGTSLVYNDGRKFRYSKDSGTGISKALMSQSLPNPSDLYTQACTADVTEGDQEVIVNIGTGQTFAEDKLANGFMIVNKTGTPLGDIYKILASKIGTTDTNIRLLLESAIRNGWTANTTEITLVRNRWMDVLVYPQAAHTGIPTGVPLIDIAADYWFWAQTKGFAPIIADTTANLVLGEEAGTPGTHDVDGAVGLPTDSVKNIIWGMVVYAAADAEVAIIDLNID